MMKTQHSKIPTQLNNGLDILAERTNEFLIIINNKNYGPMK